MPSMALRVGPPEAIGPRKGHPTWRIRLSRDGRTLAAVTDDEAGRLTVTVIVGRRLPETINELADAPSAMAVA